MPTFNRVQLDDPDVMLTAPEFRRPTPDNKYNLWIRFYHGDKVMDVVASVEFIQELFSSLDAFNIPLDAFNISLDAFNISLDAFNIPLDAFNISRDEVLLGLPYRNDAFYEISR